MPALTDDQPPRASGSPGLRYGDDPDDLDRAAARSRPNPATSLTITIVLSPDATREGFAGGLAGWLVASGVGGTKNVADKWRAELRPDQGSRSENRRLEPKPLALKVGHGGRSLQVHARTTAVMIPHVPRTVSQANNRGVARNGLVASDHGRMGFNGSTVRGPWCRGLAMCRNR